MSDEQSALSIPMPLPETRVFRYEAMDDMLTLLYRNPHREFTVTQIRELTGHGGKTVDASIRLLGELDLVHTTRDGRRKLVSIDQERVTKPDESILEIPQEEFRTPVREFVRMVEESQGDDLVGVLVFGSVARGSADRASDVDLLAVVDDDLVKSRRDIQEVRQEIENTRFDGERYELQVMVESVESARDHGEKLREIFVEAVTVYDTEKLDELREVVLDG